jgi:hypothetical protein
MDFKTCFSILDLNSMIFQVTSVLGPQSPVHLQRPRHDPARATMLAAQLLDPLEGLDLFKQLGIYHL